MVSRISDSHFLPTSADSVPDSQVKRMMEALGKKVTYLKRLSMGPLALPSDLPTGKYRSLTEKELELLKSAGNR